MAEPSSRRVQVLIGVFLGLALVFRIVTHRAPRPEPPKPPPGRILEEPDAGTIATTPVPSGDLHAKYALFDAAVYHSKKLATAGSTLVASLPAAKPFVRVDKPQPAPPEKARVTLLEPPIAELLPPSVDTLKYFGVGLTNTDKESLSHAEAVTVMAFAFPVTESSRYREALRLVSDFASKTGGFLWDESTRQALSSEAWAKRLANWNDDVPTVRDHVTLHMYRDGELVRIVSLGMSKFGLPDVVVNNVSGHSGDRMGELVHLLCQTLVERGRLERAGAIDLSFDTLVSKDARERMTKSLLPGAARKLTVSLSQGQRQEGDAENRLIEIVFPGPASSLQNRHAEALATLFGAKDDVVKAAADDEELNQASARARVELMKLKPRWTKGRPALETLIVKGPFKTTSGGIEWMWVEVLDWKGTKIGGLLQNDALDNPALKVGTRVEVEEEAVFDYMLRKPDGTMEGGTTSAILQKQAH